MEKYIDRKITDFLDELSSHASVPGGGSAAALTGALGASLLSMVSHFTLGKESYKAVHSEVRKILSSSYHVRDEFRRLIDEDVESYMEVTRARRSAKLLTRKSSGEKLQKSALRRALVSSLNLCKTSHQGLLLSKKLLTLGNKNLKSDTLAALFFFYASFEAGVRMSEDNARWMKDSAMEQKMKRILQPLRKDVTHTIKAIQRKP